MKFKPKEIFRQRPKMTVTFIILQCLLLVMVTCLPTEKGEEKQRAVDLKPVPVHGAANVPANSPNVAGNSKSSLESDLELVSRAFKATWKSKAADNCPDGNLPNEKEAWEEFIRNMISELDDNTIQQICQILCSMDTCPPECPGNYAPPWNGK